MSSSCNERIMCVHVGGQVVQQPNGPSYAGGTVLLLSIPRGITLTDLRQLITNAGRLPSTVMKITYAYPTLSFPRTMYTYVGVEVVDDNGVNIIFDVADGISGYTPTLYTEVLDDNNFRQEVGGSQCNSLPIHRSTQRSHRPHERDPSKQQYLDSDTCFAYDMHDDSTILEQLNDYVEHNSEFDNNLLDDNEVSQSSEEDVDEGLQAEDHEEHEIPEFELPSSMFTDDTWTNIVDPSSQMPSKSHVGWDGHCELFKGQVFFSKEEVQNTVKKYSMQQNTVVKTSASSPTMLVYKCKNPVPCQWRLRARKCKDADEWIISRYAGPHTCVAESVTQDHHNLDARFISEIIAPIVKKDASTKVKVLQAMIVDRPEGFQPSYAKTWAAKQIAIARIFGNWDESYAEVESFLAAVKVKNPGTEYILLSKDTNIPGCRTFDRLFWAFGPAIEGFKHSRPVISIDGTFLTGKYKGVILVAVTQDAENQIFPIAFAIVEKEDANNWGWFLSCLRNFVTNRTELCLISDRHTGLLSYIKGDPLWRPPHAYHRYCARHIGANYMRRFNKVVGIQVKVTAMEIQKRKFKAQLEKTKKFGDNEKVYKELTEDLGLKKWSFAHDGGRRYGSETTNISESLNGVLKEARHLPIMGTVMMTFYKSVNYFNDRAVEARKKIETGGNWSTFAIKKYKHWRKKALRHQVIEFDRAAQTYEVQTPMNQTSPYKGNHRHSVDMINRTCSCNKFQQWKMPCSHVLATCMSMKTSPFEYFSDVWSLKSIIQMYASQPFRPPRDKAYWPEINGPTIIPDREQFKMTSYTVRDIYKAMGRSWVDEGDQFDYPLNPRLRWSTYCINTMQAEWAYWLTRLPILLEDCRACNARIPRQLAITMPTYTHELLLKAINRMREECNRMSMRIKRLTLANEAAQCASEGFLQDAQRYLSWSNEEELKSDVELSDEEDM
ncbi:hypothetical protein RHGRI_029912 [Rhododendron griersonianum]|uniref:SWIM-type domain-containing protein n=1 Tax=Rhododendron griersonianum TaxID=479676 RepID=A0AAV6IL51_9ERIC|nr:hypothetical protein RHGRI_029912 [Rhododendron griersonianum]